MRFRIKKKLSINKLAALFFFIYILTDNMMPHTQYSQISLFIYLGISLVYFFTKLKIYLNPLIISYGVLIIYQVILGCSMIAVDSNETFLSIKTMCINFIYLIATYTFMVRSPKLEIIEKILIWSAFISLLIVMLINYDSLLTGRLAHAYGEGAVSYYIFGTPVAIASNKIATYSAIGLFFSLYYFGVKKEKLYSICIAIFGIGIILTGSRKGILMGIMLYCVYILIYGGKNKVFNLMKLIIVTGLILLLILKVPTLYSVMGERLEALFLNFLGYETAEGSISARARYGAYAVEMIKKRKWFGYGLGYFKELYGNVTENNYYEMLVGGGIIGLIINYSYVPFTVVKVLKTHNKEIMKYLGIFSSMIFIQWGSVIYLDRASLMFLMLIFVVLRRYASNNEKYKTSI